MPWQKFWRWYDRAGRVEFAGTLLDFVFDWRTWISTVLGGSGGALTLLWAAIDGRSPLEVWAFAVVAFAGLTAGVYFSIAALEKIRHRTNKVGPTNPPVRPKDPLPAAIEPQPDMDAREAFFQILETSAWRANQLANAPDPRTSRSDWLRIRLSSTIHNYLAQDKLTAWGELSLPRGTGPLRKIKAEEWDQIEVLFDDLSAAIPRTIAKWRSNDRASHFGIMFSRSQIFRLFPPANSTLGDMRPMFEVVSYVSKSIGDRNSKEFFPLARLAIRQAALDRAITVRGNKSAGIMGEGGYSEVQTDIPPSYWEGAEIGVLATNNEADEHPPHTFPHQYSDGRYGERIVLYARLRVRWADILKRWS